MAQAQTGFGINAYNIYKTKDGEECLEKTYYLTKYAGISGFVFSFYEMALFSRPPTVRAIIARFGRFTLPFAGMGFVFGSSLCLLGKIRQKNDIPNHVIAGALAGSLWGFKYNSIHIGHTWAVVFGFCAGYIKFFKYYDIPLFQMKKECFDQEHPALNFSYKMYDDPGRPNEA